MMQAPPTIAALTPAQYAAILERHHLPAATKIVVETPYTVVIDDVVRLHFSDNAPHLLAKLALIQSRLQGAGMPVAEVLALDTSRELVAADLLLERAVPGVLASDIWATLPRVEQEVLSEALGRIVATIHNLAWPSYGDFDPAHGTLGRYGRWIEVLIERINVVSQMLHDTPILPVRLVDGAIIALNDGDSLIETASPPTLSHGALSWDHVCLQQVAGTWQIGAIQGWSGAITADDAWEFAHLWLHRNCLYPDPDYFLSGYRGVRPLQSDRRARSALYRLLIHLEGAIGAHQTADIFHYARHEAALLRLLQK